MSSKVRNIKRKTLDIETHHFNHILRCLKEEGFVCRSVTFDTLNLLCYLSRYTKDTNPKEVQEHEDFDYLENECLRGDLVLANHPNITEGFDQLTKLCKNKKKRLCRVKRNSLHTVDVSESEH